MKKTVLLGTLLAFCGTFPLWAADTAATDSSTSLTLETAQKEALEHSPLYRKAQAAEREAGWGQLEAFSEGFLPHLHAKGQYFLSDPLQYTSLNVAFGSAGQTQIFSFPGIFPEKTVTFDADFDLFDGFKNVHRLDTANNLHEAARIQSDFALLQLGEQVRLKFYVVLGEKLLSDMADQNVKTLEDHLRIVQDQLDNGQATKYDVLRVEVQLSEAKSDQISAHDNEALAREALVQTMGLPKDNRDLAGGLPDLDADALLKDASKTDYMDSPQLKASHLQALAASDQSAASSASLWVPRVSLIGEYQWYNSPNYIGGLQENTDIRNSYFLGASASWDILDGGLSFARANEAGEKAKEAKADYEAAQLQAPYDLDQWKRRLASGVALYKAKEQDVDKAKESARLATVGFKAGSRTTTDVLDAELEEYRASAGLVTAKLDALEALINLELVTGKRLAHD